MPDLWDTSPDNVPSPPDAQANPGPSDHDDHSQEIRLTDDRGRLRLRFPAYVLIALGIAVIAIAVTILAVLVGFT
jgi:hypothetical protein